MASDDLDIPQIAVVGVPDDNSPTPTLDASPPTSPDNTSSPLHPLGHASTPSDNHGFLPLPTPILRNSRNSLDIPSSPASHTSDASSLHPPPSPTLSAHSSGSIRWATSTVLRENNPEEHDGLSSLGLLAPPPPGHHRKGSTATVSSIGSIFTDRDNEDSPGLALSPVRSGQSDVPSTLPSPTNTHVDAGSDTSRPSSAAGFFKRTVQRVRHPSPSPSGDTDIGSDTTRNDSVQKGDNADVKRKGAELARPALLDLKQEADLNVEPFAFKPLQLASLVDPKSLENLESLGGVEGLIRGLGTNRLRGLSTTLAPPSQLGSPDPGAVNAVTPSGVEMTPPKPNIMITSPAGVPEGLQSTASLGGVGRPASLKYSEGAYEATIRDRQRIYGRNILPQRPSKSLLLLMWLALQDKVIVLLSIAAVVSLALGLFQDFGTPRPEGEPPVDWVEGVAIIAAILIVVAVGSLNDWQKERQFQVLNEKKEDRLVKVIRDGGERQIDVHEVVVGDVVLLEPGEVIPCDGVFLSGHNVRCDESSATGESDAIKKLSYEECIALREKRLMEFDPDGPSGDGESISAPQRKTNPSGLELLGHTDCFVISGSKVLEGVGSYVVISVGTKSFNGRIMMALRRDSENTPLQLKLNALAETIAKIGSIAGGLLFAALLIRYFVQLGSNNPQRTSSEKGIAFVNILIISVTLVVVAVPEGLPLAVTLALAFATKRMTKENLLVRVLGSCETMANASVICTDKTGTLTQNEMTVVAGSVGVHAKFVRRLEENRGRTGGEVRNGPNAKDFAVDVADLDTVLSHPLKDLFNAAIAINSTAFEDLDPESGAPVFIGSKTETALLAFAKELGWPNYKDTRDSAIVIQMVPFSSDRKSMGCVVRLPDGSHRLYIKGASEVLARKCTRHVVAYRDSANKAPDSNQVETVPIGEMEEDNISRTITFYASQALRTIALCYRDFPHWPPPGMRLVDKNEVDYDDLTTDLTLICITGIEDPLRPGVREAVANCGKAGVRVKMCTGDNVLTARSIAQQCGIYTTGGIVMEGPHFRTLSPDVMKAIVPRLQVLARSSPEDKRILVETLKELGDIVGVTGDGTNDGPALKTAHVGFSMGIAGTEVAKEASDIILMDDNFSSIVKAIMWGRCVNDAVRKFLQFQIATNVTAVVITFVSALASNEEEGVLSAVQLLWINIIMDTFAALALATDPASPVLLNRKPDKKTDPLFTVNMIKQILGQATYQIIVILIFHFLGSRILGFHHSDDSTLQKRHDGIVQTLVFNAFVFAQIFNSFNCRRLDQKLNIFEGISNNWYFVAITIIEVAVQVLICFVGGAAFDVTRMGIREWGISLALGCVSIPLGALIRLMPNERFERFFKMVHLLPKSVVLPTTRPGAEPGFSFAVDQVRDNLGTFAKLRGGRMRGSSFVRKSRSAFPDSDGPRLVPGLLAMVPSLVASHVVAPDWQPRTDGSLSDPAGFDPSRSSAALWENKFEVHPDTPRDDPVYRLLNMTQRPVTPR
ncbi:calcium-translocating P-type ATPase [Lactarius sanguifluus]|nr:calcium-translocating P-type ATPase [Lactarius sanguifluus]